MKRNAAIGKELKRRHKRKEGSEKEVALYGWFVI